MSFKLAKTKILRKSFDKNFNINWNKENLICLLACIVPAPHVSVRPYPWPTGQHMHTFMKRCVSLLRGALPHSKKRILPPRSLRVGRNINLEITLQSYSKRCAFFILTYIVYSDIQKRNTKEIFNMINWYTIFLVHIW